MIRAAPVAVVVAAFAALAACGQAADNGKAPSPTPNSAPSASPTRIAKAAAPSCAPAPMLALSQDFADPRDEFGEDSKPFKQLEGNFAAAYKKACGSGVLAKAPLIPKDAPHPDMLFLTGAPEANYAAIYRETNDGDQPGDMTLEYYFITPDGQLHVPSIADLNEAIYCAVQGATEQEQDTSGRCLVD